MMFKIVLQCFIHDLVVAMILAPILKHPFPRLAIFELSACNDSHHASGFENDPRTRGTEDSIEAQSDFDSQF